MFTLLHSCPHYPSPEPFHLTELILCPHEAQTLIPFPWAPSTPHSTFCLWIWRLLSASHGWDPVVLTLLWLAYFTWHDILKVRHVTARIRIPFLFKSVIFHYKHRAHLLPIHPSVDAWDAWQWRRPLWTWVCTRLFKTLLPSLLWLYGGVEMLGRMAVLCLIFGKLASSFPPQPPHLTSPPTALKGPFHFATSSPTCAVLCFSVFLCHSRPNGCEGESHCGLELHFPKG